MSDFVPFTAAERRTSETGSGILVDWSHDAPMSIKSVPITASQRERIERNASLFDSDSSDEYKRRRYHSRNPSSLQGNTSLLQALTSSSMDDDEPDAAIEEDDIMILTDNSDDDDERSHLQRSRITSLTRSLEPFGGTSSIESSPMQERGRIAALFAQDKPWLAHLEDSAGRSKALDLCDSPSVQDQDDDILDLSQGLILSPPPPPPPPPPPILEDESTDSEWSGDLLDGYSIHSDLSGFSEIQLDEQVEFDNFALMPNSFLGSGKLHPSMALYVDAEELGNVTKRDANHFVLEHTIMLRAVLQLLQDQELHQSMDDVILKKGPLKKKLGHSVGRPTWKVKYVEVGYGSFSYYEDSNMKDRKTIALNGESSVEIHDNINFAFELNTSSRKKILWMANSEEERQSWMTKLRVSMTGKPKKELDLAPFQLSMERFSRMQNNLRLCRDKEAYLGLLGEMWETDVTLPTAYLSVRAEAGTKGRCVADFWTFLGKATIVLNGHAVPVESPHNAARIVGSLSRCVLEYDRSGDRPREQLMTEVQALSYSREVLMAVWKSRSHDDSHNLIDTMTQNVNLTICLPYHEDTNVYFHVTYTTPDDLVDTRLNESQDDMSGWVRTRSKAFKNWKNRFVVISESVLSYYAHGSPRPHGLRGQIALAGATLQPFEDRQEHHLFILKITSKDARERQLSFRDEADYLDWKHALQKAIDACTTFGAILSKATRRRPGQGLIKGATRDTGRMIKGAADGGFSLLQRGLGAVKKTVSFDTNKLEESESWPTRLSEHGKQNEPTVRLTAEACSYYKIISSDPSGDDKNDIWTTVRARRSQVFLLSGGTHGRINKGEEVVALTFREGLVDPANFGENNRTYDVSSNYSRVSDPKQYS